MKGKKAELRKRLTQSLESKVTETKISENKSEEDSSCNDLLKVTDFELFLHVDTMSFKIKSSKKSPI